MLISGTIAGLTAKFLGYKRLKMHRRKIIARLNTLLVQVPDDLVSPALRKLLCQPNNKNEPAHIAIFRLCGYYHSIVMGKHLLLPPGNLSAFLLKLLDS